MSKLNEAGEKVSFTSVEFINYKAFSRFSVSLQSMNLLVGPNNCGKSTLLGAFRALEAGLRKARSRNPERVSGPRSDTFGYKLDRDSIPISIENVHTDYADSETTVIFRLSNGNRLVLYFPEDGGCVLVAEPVGRPIGSTTAFKGAYPISISIVPVLGPVEHQETLLKAETIQKDAGTHRASRHFRNYWYHFPEGFETFAELVSRTWPRMQIQSPELSSASATLAMFCLEGRMTRELYWSGFGFQIWCQLLTHIARAADSSLIVVDEPEVYLHPDVQRQLLSLLRQLGPDILLATHSTEILGEADPSEIVLIDKSRRSGIRLRDAEGIQRVLDAVGSVQNLTLTRLAKNRRVVFFEGTNDYTVIRSFARQIGLAELASGTEITALVSEGFSSWEKISSLGWGLQRVLGQQIQVAVIYDRDYYCAEDIQARLVSLRSWITLAHVHDRKEIENYLLIQQPLERALAAALADKKRRTGDAVIAGPSIRDLLEEVTAEFRSEIISQLIARRLDYLQHSRRDSSEIIAETSKEFDAKWIDMETRVELISGKIVLRRLREKIQTFYGVTLTDQRIISSFHKTDIPADLMKLLENLDKFRSGFVTDRFEDAPH